MLLNSSSFTFPCYKDYNCLETNTSFSCFVTSTKENEHLKFRALQKHWILCSTYFHFHDTFNAMCGYTWMAILTKFWKCIIDIHILPSYFLNSSRLLFVITKAFFHNINWSVLNIKPQSDFIAPARCIIDSDVMQSLYQKQAFVYVEAKGYHKRREETSYSNCAVRTTKFGVVWTLKNLYCNKYLAMTQHMILTWWQTYKNCIFTAE